MDTAEQKEISDNLTGWAGDVIKDGQESMPIIEDIKRTHTCGELRTAQAGQTVRLNGWVYRRDLGAFIDLRDRHGSRRLSSIPKPRRVNNGTAGRANRVGVEGTAQKRPDGTNRKLPTGEVEYR